MSQIIQCILDAIPEDERDAQVQRSRDIFGNVASVVEKPDGYTFILLVNRLTQVATWISFERLCCPFFTFELRVKPAATMLELSLSGNDDVKRFVQAEFVEQIVNGMG